MKNMMLRAIQYLVVSIFVSFLMYLISPFFPGLSIFFIEMAKDINRLLKTQMNPRTLGVFLAFAIFLIVYFILSKMAILFRKRAGVEWSEVNPLVRYASVPFSVFKILISILLCPLIYGFTRALCDTILSLSMADNRMLAFSIGFAIWSILWLLFWKKWGFFSILEHEITHMIVGMCFLHRPKKLMVVENEGGWVQLAGVNFIITLAPYFLLTLCFLMLPLYLVIQPRYIAPYFFVMGVFTSYHTLSTIRETRINHQPDIVFTGKYFSLVVIILGNIFCYGFILAFIQAGFSSSSIFIEKGWHYSLEMVRNLAHVVTG